jgi:PadR family transcriptional regulator PadR
MYVGGELSLFDKELLKGSTEILILSLLNREPMYGYQIIKEAENKSEGVFHFKEGTLYPLLHSLEADGFLKSYWLEYEGRKRKYYRITATGKKHMEKKLEEWKIFSSAVNRIVLEGCM